MEPPTCPPYMSPQLALELLRTPPAPIPKSDPLLFGRSSLLHQLSQARSAAPDIKPACSLDGSCEASAPQALPARATCVHGLLAAAQRDDSTGYRQLPSHAATELSYDEFVWRYMEPNQPVVIRGVSSGWRATSEWRAPDGRLRLQALRQLAGHCRVCVTDTGVQDGGCGEVRTMSLAEYLDWWCGRTAQCQQQQEQEAPLQSQQELQGQMLRGQQQQAQQQAQQQDQAQVAPESELVVASCGCQRSGNEHVHITRATEAPGSREGDTAPHAGRAKRAVPKPYGATGQPPPSSLGPELGEEGGGGRVCGCGPAPAAAAGRSELGANCSYSGRGLAAGVAGAAGQGALLYLKDWHFVAEFPDYGAYRLPAFFADDWLNHYYDQQAQHARDPGAGAAGEQPIAACRGSGVGAEGNNGTALADPPAAAAAAAAAAATSRASGAVPAFQGAELGRARQPLPPHQEEREEEEEVRACPAGDGGCGRSPSEPDSCGASSASASAPPAAFTSDYRFCYLGPAGTWTPLHSDVLRSYSWSANVCGRKRWLMLHPQYTHLLYDRQLLRMAPHLELDRVRSGCDPRDFPGLEEARRHAFEFIQETGDAVFVPSGWHHCVENMLDTLSFNHNWFNGHNCHWTWALLRQQYMDAAEAIEDCRPLCQPDEFEDLVQANLAANAGLNWHDFIDLLSCTVHRALGVLHQDGENDAAVAGSRCLAAGAAGLAAEAEDAAPEVANALLALHRAGRLLHEYVVAFEELVLRSAGAQQKRSTAVDMHKDDDAVDRLRGSESITAARSLLLVVKNEFLSWGCPGMQPYAAPNPSNLRR